MPYVPPKYPGAIPTAEDLPNRTDDVDWMYAARYNELKKELRAALIELGTLPKGAHADVKTRLDNVPPTESPVFTGDATIPTINLTGGQIKFPAAQAASGDANTLDDYEEGTWTPDLQFGGAKVGIAYVVRGGHYTKIGRLVMVSCRLTLSSKGSSNGVAEIYGLPFTSKNATGAVSSTSLFVSNISFTDTPQAYVPINSSRIPIQEITNAGLASLMDDTNFANNTTIRLSFVYNV